MKHLLTFLRHDVSGTLASTVGSPSAHRRGTMLKHYAFMLLFLLGSLNVWATEELYYTLTPANGTNNSYAGSCDIAISGITWNLEGNSQVQPWKLGANNKTALSKTNKSIYSKTAIDENITKIEITHGASSNITVNSMTVIVSKNSDFTSPESTLTPTFAASSTVTVNRPEGKDWSNCYYKITYNLTGAKSSANSIQFSEAKFYHEVGGEGGSSNPTLSADPVVIDFGTVDQNADVAAKTVAVTYSNLTGSVTYSGLSGVFTATGTISASGDEITITPSTATIGEHEQTLTIQSMTDSKSQDVTVTMNVVAPFDGLKLTFDVSSNPGEWPTDNSTTTTNYTYTLNEVDYTFALNNVKCNSGYLMLTSVAKLGLPAISGYKLVKVEATNSGGCSTSTQVSVSSSDASKTDVTGGAVQTWGTTNTKYTYNLSETEENTMYYLWIANKNCQLVTLELYYEEVAAAAVAKPTISGETPFLTSTTVTLTQAEADAIYYTTNGDDPTTSSTEYSVPFEVNATTTIKAIAVKGEDVSAVAEMTFTKATILTVAQAKTAIDAGGDLSNKYVAGIVSQIDSYNSSYNSLTYWISDDGTTANQLQVYSGLAGVVKNQFASEDDIHVGDDVTVKGTLKKYSSTYEFDKNNVIVAYKPIALLSWSAASYDAELGGSNSFPKLTNTNSVSVTYSSSNTDAATINATTGEISLVAEGSTTIKATFAGNENYKANAVSYTLTVASSVVHATISFDVDGGVAIEPLTDKQAIVLSELPTAVKDGKNFGGWFKDENKNVPVVAEALTGDVTLYAKWLDPYTVAQAKVVIDANPTGTENQYVAGIISQIDSYNTTYHSITYWISADGTTTNQLQVYSGLIGNAATALEKEQFTAKTDLELGDAVVVTGTLKLHNETYEFDKNNSIYTFSRKVSAGLAYEITAIQKTVDDDLFINPLTNPNSVTVTYSSSDENIALVDENTGEVLVSEEGTATITAAFAGNATYKAAEVSYIVTVSAAADTRKVANSPDKFTTTNGDLDPTDIAFEAFKGGASTNPANYNDGIRLYQAPSADAIGGFITLKAKKGCTIDQVKITTTDTYATTVAYSVDGNEHLLGSGSVAKSGDYSTPSGLNVESVNIVNKGSDKNSRLEIASIKVWYTGDALAVDHYFLGGTYETTFEQNGTFDYTGLEVYAAYDAGETITEPVEGFTVEADLSTAGPAKASVMLNSVKIAEYDITVTAGKENPALAYSPVSETITAGDAWSAPTLSNIFHVTPITYSSDKESVATVTSEGVITLAGGYGTAVITAHFDESAAYIESEATYTITVNKPAATPTSTVYRKVTATADITDGEYLIVYEGDTKHDAAVFDGSLDDVDQAKKALPVKIVNNEIAGNTDLDAAVFTIDVTAGTLQSASGWYIGRTANSNGLDKSTTEAYANTFAITNGAAVITSSAGPTLRYNYASDQLRFRYYTSGQQAIQLYKKETATPPTPVLTEVRTGLTAGNYYTICYPKAMKNIQGATLWSFIGKDAEFAYLEEETATTIKAGKPYILYATASTVQAELEGEDAAAGSNGAIHGTLVPMDQDALNAAATTAGHDLYLVIGNKLHQATGVPGTTVGNSLPANRAYVILDEITGGKPAPAPGRNVRSMPMHKNAATGMDELNASEAPRKMIIDGKMYIFRGEKMYDATGRLVK